jgi:hypothetical protein
MDTSEFVEIVVIIIIIAHNHNHTHIATSGTITRMNKNTDAADAGQFLGPGKLLSFG